MDSFTSFSSANENEIEPMSNLNNSLIVSCQCRLLIPGVIALPCTTIPVASVADPLKQSIDRNGLFELLTE